MAILGLAILRAEVPSANAGTLSICAAHYQGDGSDFTDEFSHGPITVPAGTVLDYAGHAFNGTMDPKDDSHRPVDAKSWIGVGDAERARRDALLLEDANALSLENRHHAAVVTMAPAVLTMDRLCTSVMAKAFVSGDWRDDVSTVFADPGVYFQAYGVLRNNRLDTDFKDNSDSFEAAAARGEINAIVTETLETAFTLPTGGNDEQTGASH